MEDAIFVQNSKSFSFASSFMPKEIREDITSVYLFFRVTDDITDDLVENRRQKERLSDYRNMVRFGKKLYRFSDYDKCCRWLRRNVSDARQRHAYRNFYRFIIKHDIPMKYASLQFKGYAMDRRLDRQRVSQVHSLKRLIRYAFCVAGTVSILLTHTVQGEVQVTKSLLFGLSSIAIGFQLTNIARDIITDAKIGRIYVPWMTKSDRKKLLRGALSNQIILGYAKEMVELADRYYCVGIPFLDKLPRQVSKGLHIATAVYRQIGLDIYESNSYPERAVISKARKIKFAFWPSHPGFVCTKDIPVSHYKWL
jgi:phytoene synthase